MSEATARQLKAEGAESCYSAAHRAAEVEGFGMSDDRRRELVGILRAELADGGLNVYAHAYAEGALDGLAPFGLYA
jgi:hypothetical protein